ncbi:MAG: hypothetical protein ACK58T_17510, partial [Phycisphaerae bacterium]
CGCGRGGDGGEMLVTVERVGHSVLESTPLGPGALRTGMDGRRRADRAGVRLEAFFTVLDGWPSSTRTVLPADRGAHALWGSVASAGCGPLLYGVLLCASR